MEGTGFFGLWLRRPRIWYSPPHASGTPPPTHLVLPPMERPRSPDSLFGDPPPPPVARRTCPPIPGLYIFPALLPDDIARESG